ncbi:MAG TPA: methyltransferase domain-containing protein [Candidatus Methylomirabilis sp.]|nr:methyltransferase domain-containing protein [Candidatus Methylomirabilis sp.]
MRDGMAAGRRDVAGIWQEIAEKYRKVAASPAGLFRYPTGEASALGLGYPPEVIAGIPAAIRDRFVGVGNPFTLGAIRPDEAVLDLGCGAGFDVLVAAQIVGPMGRVVGVDFSPDMLAVAEEGRVKTGCPQVVLCQAAIEALPFPAGCFDVAISNGVLNLVPDKQAALREVVRVLRPGGRLQACDIGLVGEEPPPDKAPWSD